MSGRFLDKRIIIRFCVKLRKNATDTCEILSEDYGRETMKKSSVFVWHKRFKESRENAEGDKKLVVQELAELMKMLEKCGLWLIHTVNQAYYGEVKGLHEAVRRKRPALWHNDRTLHHDNVPVHKALTVKQFLAQKSITEKEHPPYSPDMAALKGRRFQDIEDVQKYDDGTETYFKTGVSKMFLTVAASLG
jgi:hypothetical protein